MEILVFIIAALFGGVGVYFYLNNKQQKENNLSEQRKIQSEISIKNAELIQENLKSQLIQLNSQFDIIKKELVSEQIRSGKAEALLNSQKDQMFHVEKKLSELNLELEKFKNLKIELETKFSNSENQLKSIKDELDLKLRVKELHVQKLTEENKVLSNKITALTEQEPLRIEQYNNQMEKLNQAIAHQQEELKRQRELKEKETLEKIREQKETWSRHEKDVEEKMKLICQQESVEYVDKENFPFSGKPDNCIKICDEYIIFDSKSPQGDDLSNLPNYIKNQAEQAKKYSKQDGVKKEIFLVVPTNSIGVIKETFINLGSYCVHVITPDALKPIIIQLKKIESYEFAEQLSPEDRSQIAKTIGRMAHGMKRTVQVSQFMNKELISILLDAEKLPDEILSEAQETESKMKLNPPNEKRTKAIKIDHLADESANISGKLIGQAIYEGEELKVIETLPLMTPLKPKGPLNS